MASNAAPPGLGNRVENAPTPLPYPTSARKPADLNADIAGRIKKIAYTDEKIAVTINRIACAEQKMEGAGAKMESTGSAPASTYAKSADASAMYACPGTEHADKRSAGATASCERPVG